MPIQTNEIIKGGFYVTTSDQLRKVTEIRKFDDNSERVDYLAKSDKIKNRKFTPAATLKNPPTIEKFAADCARKLDDNEVQDRRKTQIILEDE